jgi:hypothetical protein
MEFAGWCASGGAAPRPPALLGDERGCDLLGRAPGGRTPNLDRWQEASLAVARSLRDLLPPSENQGSVGDCPTEEITQVPPVLVR